jgi:hypothetical protein
MTTNWPKSPKKWIFRVIKSWLRIKQQHLRLNFAFNNIPIRPKKFLNMEITKWYFNILLNWTYINADVNQWKPHALVKMRATYWCLNTIH